MSSGLVYRPIWVYTPVEQRCIVDHWKTKLYDGAFLMIYICAQNIGLYLYTVYMHIILFLILCFSVPRSKEKAQEEEEETGLYVGAYISLGYHKNMKTEKRAPRCAFRSWCRKNGRAINSFFRIADGYLNDSFGITRWNIKNSKSSTSRVKSANNISNQNKGGAFKRKKKFDIIGA